MAGFRKDLTNEQIKKIEEFFKDRTSLTMEEAMTFIKENDLPWDSYDGFRMWAKNHRFWSPDLNSGPQKKGLQKFGSETDAMAAAKLLLGDKEDAITAAVTQLEAEIKEIEETADQQIAKINSDSTEKIKERMTLIESLKEQLNKR